MVKEALDLGRVDVNDINSNGNSLLHMAASQVYACSRTLHGKSCIMRHRLTRCLRQGHKALVKELLRRGADPQLTNFAGKKCYDMAHDLNYWVRT